MEHHVFKSLKTETSLLGLGCMRFPRTDNDEIDMERVCNMVDECMERGVNYYDTAYVYGPDGESENAVRKALVERYPRESFMLADKLPSWVVESEKKSPQEIFSTTCDRLGVDYIDFYLIHSLDDENWNLCKKHNLLEFAKELKRDGKIKRLGFSFHGTVDLLKEIIAVYDWDFVQLQLNYYDWETNQRAREQYEIVHNAGIPCIVMEPVRGGALANPHPNVLAPLKEILPEATPASWALRFVGSLDGVATVLSGMSDEAQVRENLDLFNNFVPLNSEEHEAVKKAAKAFEALPIIPCTGCNYCDGCPKKIEIPKAFRAYNNALQFNKMDTLRENLEPLKLDTCIECGVCAGHCPQHISVPEQLKRIRGEAGLL